MNKILIFILSIFIFSSCAFHSGVMTGNASITDPNFQYVALAEGSAITTHVFGIGGLKKKALTFEAKKDLLKNYPLKKGQALANVTTDMKRTFVFCVVRTKMTVTADVIDFNIGNSYQTFDSLIADNYADEIDSKNGIGLLDSVYFSLHGSMRKGKVLRFGKHGVKIGFYSIIGNKNYQYTSPYETTLLKSPTEIEESRFGYEIDETIRFVHDSGKIKDGLIFGINLKYVGVKYDMKNDGEFSWVIIPISRIQKLR